MTSKVAKSSIPLQTEKYRAKKFCNVKRIIDRRDSISCLYTFWSCTGLDTLDSRRLKPWVVTFYMTFYTFYKRKPMGKVPLITSTFSSFLSVKKAISSFLKLGSVLLAKISIGYTFSLRNSRIARNSPIVPR